MKKKYLIVGGAAAVALFFICITVFATIQEFKERKAKGEDYTFTPTTWSQKGDYKIEETSQGTKISNPNAGFSFVVPKGWKTDGGGINKDYSIVAISPEASLRGGVFVENGCTLSIATILDKNRRNAIQDDIVTADKMGYTASSKQVVVMGSYKGTQELLISSLNGINLDRAITDILVGSSEILTLDFTNRYSDIKNCEISLGDIFSTFSSN